MLTRTGSRNGGCLGQTRVNLGIVVIPELKGKQELGVQGQPELYETLSRKTKQPGLVAHTFNPSTQEAEAGGFLSLRSAWSTK
jgi:major histocompatibility complex class I